MTSIKNIIKNFLNLSYYVSELDQFLAYLAHHYPKPSASQRREKAKYARVYHMRDTPVPDARSNHLWNQF